MANTEPQKALQPLVMSQGPLVLQVDLMQRQSNYTHGYRLYVYLKRDNPEVTKFTKKHLPDSEELKFCERLISEE